MFVISRVCQICGNCLQSSKLSYSLDSDWLRYDIMRLDVLSNNTRNWSAKFLIRRQEKSMLDLHYERKP